MAPYEKYVFQEENQLKNEKNCLEEGKKKLQEGDLPSAVLLFEAAVQENPDNSEAWVLLGTSQVSNSACFLAWLKRTQSLKSHAPQGYSKNSILGYYLVSSKIIPKSNFLFLN